MKRRKRRNPDDERVRRAARDWRKGGGLVGARDVVREIILGWLRERGLEYGVRILPREEAERFFEPGQLGRLVELVMVAEGTNLNYELDNFVEPTYNDFAALLRDLGWGWSNWYGVYFPLFPDVHRDEPWGPRSATRNPREMSEDEARRRRERGDPVRALIEEDRLDGSQAQAFDVFVRGAIDKLVGIRERAGYSGTSSSPERPITLLHVLQAVSGALRRVRLARAKNRFDSRALTRQTITIERPGRRYPYQVVVQPRVHDEAAAVYVTFDSRGPGPTSGDLGTPFDGMTSANDPWLVDVPATSIAWREDIRVVPLRVLERWVQLTRARALGALS